METASRLVFTFVLNGLWQVPLVCASAWVVTRLMRNGPASHRQALWIGALVLAVALPVLSLRSDVPGGSRLAFSRDLADRAASSAAPRATANPPAAMQKSASSGLAYAPTVAAILAVFYFGIVLYRALRLSWAWLNAANLRSRCAVRDLPEPVESALARARAALGEPRAELLWSDALASPVMAGVFRKTIVLPGSMREESSEHVLTTAIGHELGHAVRNDFGWNLLCEIVALPISCHPAVYFMLRRIRETRELACDELVTARLIAPRDYARSMAEIAAQMTAPVNTACALGVFDGDILEERIRRLLDASPRLRYARWWCAAGFGVLALCGVMASGMAISAHAQGTTPAANASVDQLRQAAAHEPNNAALHLRLANAVLAQTTPGAPDKRIDEARAEYLKALAIEPRNHQALEGLMSAAINAKTYDDARLWAKQLLEVDANDTSALYSIGFIDWVTAYPDYARARTGMPMDQQGMLADAAARQTFRARYEAQIEEGLKSDRAAVRIDPNYSDAMAYINLLLRIKAGYADTPAAAAALVSEANDWVTQALDAKRRNALQPTVASAARSAGPLASPPPPPPPPPNTSKVLVSSNPAPPHRGEGSGAYWQVIGATASTVEDLAQSLKAKGFPSIQAVVTQTGDGLHAYVMVGPYADAELPQAKSALEAAGYRIVQQW